jgi:cytochrome c biogenesis protein CcdA
MISNLLKYLFDFSGKGWHRNIFMYGLYLSYILFFIAFTGIISFSPDYLYTLKLFIRYYIIFVLLIRFNPLISKENVKVDSEFDRRLVFSAAFFMLISSSLFDFIENYVHNKL